ncbi:MAG: hypothetical protein R3D51_14205 [Hyphomicrobiaceae bacterium]
MSKTINTLAALFVAAIAVPSAADAGGVRLQFGGPLGSFVAHPNLSSGPGGTMKNRGYAETRSYHANKQRELARARKIELARAAAKAQAIAEAKKAREIAAARAVAEARRQKLELAERAARKVKMVQTAKLTDKTVTTDAPVIYVPESPLEKSKFTGTQSTPAPVRTNSADAGTVNTGPGTEAEDKTEVVVLPVVEATEDTGTVTNAETATTDKTDTAEDTQPSDTAESTSVAEVAGKICRRFSAAIAGMITVPCN